MSQVGFESGEDNNSSSQKPELDPIDKHSIYLSSDDNPSFSCGWIQILEEMGCKV
jgi:hypothetical protein